MKKPEVLKCIIYGIALLIKFDVKCFLMGLLTLPAPISDKEKKINLNFNQKVLWSPKLFVGPFLNTLCHVHVKLLQVGTNF